MTITIAPATLTQTPLRRRYDAMDTGERSQLWYTFLQDGLVIDTWKPFEATGIAERFERALDTGMDRILHHQASVQGCACADAVYRAPRGWCKHRISIWLRTHLSGKEKERHGY